jgi:RNA polymerase sigma-70 factor (ECF subfamily)
MTDPQRPDLVEVEGIVRASPLDRHAWVTEAFSTYHAEIFQFLRRSTGETEAAEDLLQDVFLRLTTEVDAGRVPVQLRAWLYRVATNLAISRGRRRTTVIRWLQRQDAAVWRETAASPEAQVVRRERTDELEAILAGLPAEARTALLLSAQGFHGEEIAVAIGRSHGATRTMLSRARLRVRSELERREAQR